MRSIIHSSPASAGSELENRLFAALPTDVDFATIRCVDERGEYLEVREGQLQPLSQNFDVGAMVTVWHDGGVGHGATSNLSPDGLGWAVSAAKRWAGVSRATGISVEPPIGIASGSYTSPVEYDWSTLPLGDRIDLLHRQASLLTKETATSNVASSRVASRIVASSAMLARRDVDVVLLASNGARIEQNFRFVYPGLSVTAADGAMTQSRTFGAGAFCGQGGPEVLERHGFGDAAERIRDQAIALLTAPNCPSGTMDVVLAPDQMVLQIHESIGHPLELDRILGDERNYAGTSFVTPEMFGEYNYGSNLLNVTFDPAVAGQLASYGFDDEGTPAQREYLIRDGVLVRGLGGISSQQRSGLPGVANARACNWNRPPIDRMANLNIEPGASSFDELVGSVERGVYLETNTSWSIDDSRNKFQFSCEYGRLIEDGKLTSVIRNPSYRGISATFWRSLKGVGNLESWQAMGTPNCGKGELNQMIGTGHASPACLFGDIDVFGGDTE